MAEIPVAYGLVETGLLTKTTPPAGARRGSLKAEAEVGKFTSLLVLLTVNDLTPAAHASTPLPGSRYAP